VSADALEVRYLTGEDEAFVTTLLDARADVIAHGGPVRRFAWYQGMAHYPGWWWSATMHDHVGYESLLERDRLMLADFDRDTVAIASQPFGLSGQLDGAACRHVPDYLLLRRDGSVLVVDVKPGRLLDTPEVASVLAWTGHHLALKGWRYEIWSGADTALLTNVRFIAQGRRDDRVNSKAVHALWRHGEAGMTLHEAIESALRVSEVERREVQASMLTLLWRQEWIVDLSAPLAGTTVIEAVEVGADARRSA